MPTSKFDFLYHIHVSDFPGNKDCAAPESSRKRKLRDSSETNVTFTWLIFRKCYCSDDLSRPIVDFDCKIKVFREIDYRLFTFVDEDDVGIVDELVAKVGWPLYGDAKFEEVNEMVHKVREAVVEAYRTGPRREKLDVMVTVMKQIGMPVDEYEEILENLKPKD